MLVVWFAGNKSYAAAVVKLLDPTGKLFGTRVIAQGAERVEDMQVDQSKSFMQVGACQAIQGGPGMVNSLPSSCSWNPQVGYLLDLIFEAILDLLCACMLCACMLCLLAMVLC